MKDDYKDDVTVLQEKKESAEKTLDKVHEAIGAIMDDEGKEGSFVYLAGYQEGRKFALDLVASAVFDNWEEAS